jgi:hypothetical protein
MGKINDMTTPCVDVASLKTLNEKPNEVKTHTKEKSTT